MRNQTYLTIRATRRRYAVLPAREIPAAREAARQFYDCQAAQGHRSLNDVQSLIGGGPTTRRSGRPPNAPAFGDHFGATPMHRISADDVSQWFAQRMAGTTTSHQTRGKSSLSVFLMFCHSQRWVPAALLVSADKMRQGGDAEARRWLRPDQLAIFDETVHASGRIDTYEAFTWETLRDTGLRTSELPLLRPYDLDETSGTLSVGCGKGGGGAPRLVPVTPSYCDRFLAHLDRHRLAGADPVFFQRPCLLLKGEKDDQGAVPDSLAPTSYGAINGVLRRIQGEVNGRVAAGEVGAHEVPQWKLTAPVMRRTFAYNQHILARIGGGGMELEQLREALGHASLDGTKVYLAGVDEYLRRAEKQDDA